MHISELRVIEKKKAKVQPIVAGNPLEEITLLILFEQILPQITFLMISKQRL